MKIGGYHSGRRSCFVIDRLSKKDRHQRLIQLIDENPFVTDRELTRQLKVSIQTIRLDRMELGIPELRERMKQMAEHSYDQVRSLSLEEVIGDVVDLQLDKSGISIFEIREEHVFSKTRIARGHYVFAQANSLAIAVINEEIALTSSADIRFLRQVRLGEKCIAKAYVRSIAGQKGKAKVEVFTYVADEMVFQGNFVIYRSAGE
ncbi:transcription factor FapR [Paenibacillus lautus]|uniref:transcription factor FapR n=1 Tax=Bacillales TaxID=1385 RepID=UPI0001788483|nr:MULTISPECIES: transcription factor FapR [Paenibacillus]MBY0160077.1 transcription factor FapR [Cytobacillus firmus]VTR45217.1 Fatty acid and phospholipid biosynthesis regulator [Actinobacillus pleuropneumoniae]ACX66474.1 fatty acid biosynthesis transcriptional regulating protein [Paenibacillus sp. Y412MC10]ETT61075.1 fatty acid biosynthesis transcriptional regulator [Paenibacillus sp. FSL H8-457]MCI1775773.1 transcription factor FapR [Paenibacillus lautus]